MELKDILHKVKENEIDIEEAMQLIDEPMDYATIDYDRQKRTGVPEVIYGAGKTREQIVGIIKNMLERGIENILVTRLSNKKYLYLKAIYPDFTYDDLAQTYICNKNPFPKNKGLVVVVCAGTSDLPVAREAVNTLSYLGNHVTLVSDVGVAGLHRLLRKMDVIKKANVIVAVAGMEGALASVIGGLTDKPVVAVPTSIGYGASFNGLAALLAMLNSCASGVSVVNIDNGFGAGYMANAINNLGGKE